MITFDVPDMSCGHCVGALTRAVREVDAGARVEADLATRQLHVDSRADAGPLLKAMQVAGYPARVVAIVGEAAPATAATTAPARSAGCGCGCR